MRWARPEIKTAKAMANKVLLMILDGWEFSSLMLFYIPPESIVS